MRAVAVWPDRREVGIVEHEEPVIRSATEVRVRILEVGVCGTDAEICGFHFGSPPEGYEYLIVGHEALGEVEEVGPGVVDLAAGDLVVPSVRRPCAEITCSACRSGHQDHCFTGAFTERGISRAHGFAADRIVEEQTYLYKVPSALRAVGVLTEPLTIAEKGIRQYVAAQRRLPWKRNLPEQDIVAGLQAVVLGAGPIGLLGCMLLLARGCRVSVYSREPADSDRAELVRSLGARYVCSEDLPYGALVRRIGSVDLVYEAAGSGALAFQALEHLGPNGAMILVGAQGDRGRIQIPADAILTRIVVGNQAVIGTVNAHGRDFAAAIADLQRFAQTWPGALQELITGRHSLPEFCRCAREREGIKRVIEVAGPAQHPPAERTSTAAGVYGQPSEQTP